MNTALQKTAILAVEFPLRVFSIEAAKRAAYVLMHRATVSFAVTDTVITCSLQPVSDSGTGDGTLECDFRRGP
jgi:hypothetical protein